MNDVFYFFCYPRGDRSHLTVIDLSYSVDYERGEWDCVNSTNYTDRDDALKEARALATRTGKDYEMFESRYDSSTDEYLGEFTDGTHQSVVESTSQVSRVYITCMGDCHNQELYDSQNVRQGKRTAREHVRSTGHEVCVEIERTLFMSSDSQVSGRD